jgi:hypothetical protein
VPPVRLNPDIPPKLEDCQSGVREAAITVRT